ncbi:MAG: rod shape-determining protein MreC [Armatimonadetes bacterium]|nr:rod shape-determining protein MreC [Armatimonadota bacterium]
MHPRVDRNVLVLAAVVAVVIGLAVSNRRGRAEGRTNPGASLVAFLVSPLQRVLDRVGGLAGSVTGAFREARHLHADNRRLREENERLRQQIHLLGEMALENARLKQMLAYRDALPGRGEDALLAPVIGINPTNWFNSIIIGTGANRGVREKQMVFTHRGLVGQVRLVTASTATVLLVTDLSSGVGARVQRTGWNGVVKGTAGPLLEMVHLPRDADVRPRDLVVTNGMGSVFQVRGVPIGTVQRVDVDENTSSKVAVVLPSVDFRRLEEVFVLTR